MSLLSPRMDSPSTLDALRARPKRREAPDERALKRHRDRFAYRPGRGAALLEELESRQMLSGSGDLTALISNLLTTGDVSGSYSFTNVAVGSFLTAPSVTVGLSGVSHTDSTHWSGKISVDAPSAAIAIGSTFTGSIAGTPTVDGLLGSYTLTNQAPGAGAYSLKAQSVALTALNIFTANATGVTLAYDPASPAGQTLATVASASATLTPLDGATATLTNLAIRDNGFSLGDGTVSSGPITLGGILAATSPSVSFSGVSYTTGSPLAGTIKATAASASLFAGQSGFASPGGATGAGNGLRLSGFAGSYALATNALSLSATGADLKLGKILDATASNLTIGYNPAAASPVTVNAASLAATSPLFAGVSGTITNLAASSAKLSFDDATLADASPISLGGVFSVSGLKLGLAGFSYTAATNAIAGTATISSASAALFPGQSAFTDSVTNFAGSYNFTTGAVALSADEVDLGFGKALSVKATGVAIGWDGTNASVALAGAAISSGYFPDVTGTLTGVTASNAGLTIDGATLTDAGTVSLGSFFQLSGLTLTVDGFSYSTATKTIGAGSITVAAGMVTLFPNKPSITDTVKNFVGSYTFATGALSLTAGEVDLKFGSYVTAVADNLSVAWDGTNAVVSLGTGTFTAKLGSFLTLSGTGSINTSPAPGADIADIDSLSASITAGPLGLSGTAVNFAINNAGSLSTTEAGTSKAFGVSFGLTDSSKIQWPSWLPIQVSTLAVSWPSFTTDPTNFALTLSASVNASFVGGKLAIAGSVTDATIDVGLLQKGAFPITSIGSASISASGTIAGGTVKGGAFISILNVDASNNPIPAGNTTTAVARRIFYGGIDAGFSIAGAAGFELRLGLSQLGPLSGYVQASVPVLLDPTTGLTLNDFYAGVDFDTSLPSITDPKQLTTNAAFTRSSQLSFDQWEAQLQGQVITQVAASGADPFAALGQTMVIQAGATLYSAYATSNAFRLDGGVEISTDGKLLVSGTATFGNSLTVAAGAYLDLSQVKAGAAALLLYVQAPANIPIMSAYGSVIVQAGSDLNLDGKSTSATIANTSLNNASFTVEFWSRRNDSGKAEVVASEGTTDFAAGYDANNDFYVGFGTSTRLTVPTADDGNWHQWAITYDKAGGTRTIYEDGVAVAHDTATPVSTTNTNLMIGQAGSTYFSGSVDAVRVWSLARTAAQVGAQYNQADLGSDTTGLVGAWFFDSGKETSDTHVAGHTLTINGTPSFTLPAGQPHAPFSADGFQVQIGGELDLTLPGLKGALQIVGSATLSANIAQKSTDLTVSGSASLDPLGQFASLAGNVHFDVNAAGTPELYGVFEANLAGLPALTKIGLSLAATGFVEFNTTSTVQDVQIQVPGASTPNSYMVAGQTVMLYVPSAVLSYATPKSDGSAGTQLFAIDADLYAKFSVATLPGNVPDPELDLAFNGNVVLGPASAPVLTLAANGVFILNSSGLAAAVNVTLGNSSSLLSKYGITLSGNSLGFAVNTFGHDVSFTTPAIIGGASGTTSFPGATYTVPGIPAIANPPAPAAGTTGYPYVALTGSLGLGIKGFSVNGNLDVLVTPTVFRIDVLAAKLSYTDSSGKQLFSLTANGGLALYDDPTHNDVGFAGLINATIGAGQGIGGASSLFSVSGTFNFEINTAGVANTINSTTIQPTTAELDVAGDLMVGPSNAQLDIHGSLQIIVNATGLSVSAQGSVALGSLGTLSVGSATDPTKPATLTIDSSGLTASFGLYGSIHPISGVTLSGSITFQINTSQNLYIIQVGKDAVKDSSGKITTPAAPADLILGGGAFDLRGTFKLSLTPPASGSGPDTFTIVATASVSVLGATLASGEFFASIYNDGAPELALYAGLTISSGKLGSSLFSFSASPDLIINTGSQSISTGLADAPTIAPKMAEFDLKHATGSILGFTASGTLIATISSGGFDFQIPQSDPLTLSFLSVGSMQIYGDINSDGSFSVTGSIRYDVHAGPFELYGGIGATIASTGFSAWFDGGANLDCGILGTVNLASVGASITVMTDHLEIAAHVKVLGIGFSFDESLGGYSPPPHNAGLDFYAAPSAAPAGSVTTFNAAAYNQANTTNLTGSDLDWEVSGPVDAVSGRQYAASGSGTSYSPTLASPGVYTVSLYDQADNHLLLKQSTINVFQLAPAVGSLNLLPNYLAGTGDTVHMAPSVTVANPSIVKVTYKITKNGAPWSGPVVTNPDLSLDITPDTPNPAALHPDVYAVTYTITDPYNGTATATGSFSTIDVHNLTVNSTADTEDTTPNQGLLGYNPSKLTLRQALDIVADNLSGSGGTYSTIRFAPSLAGQTIVLTGGDQYGVKSTDPVANLNVDRSIVIDASNAPGLTIGAGSSPDGLRAFGIGTGGSLTLDDLNIAGFSSLGEGGAIYLATGGSLVLNQTSFRNNTITGGSMKTGGVAKNVIGAGGAIYVASGATLTATDSTFANNSTDSYGGALYVAGRANLLDDTISANSAGAAGSGVFAGIDDMNGGGQLSFVIYNTIIAGNFRGDFNDTPTANIVAGDHNIIPSMSADIRSPGGTGNPLSLSSANPGLGLLAQRDGIWCYSLLANSPALGQGRTSWPSPAPTSISVPATDARGLARTVGGLTDIGAFERQAYVVTNPISVGPGSLAEALATDDDGSNITFAPNLTGIALAGRNVTTDPSGDGSYSTTYYYNGPLTISRNVNIIGPAGGKLAISGGLDSRLIIVNSGVTASISNLSLLDGQANDGGAIYNAGALTLNNVYLAGNVAQGDFTVGQAGLGAGGAIYNASKAKLTITNSTLSNNAAIGLPGVFNGTTGATPDGRAHSYDGGQGRAGAIDNEAGATLILSGDTFGGNTATGGAGTSGTFLSHTGPVNYAGAGGPGYGGAIVNLGTATVASSTFADNGTAGGAGAPNGYNQATDILNSSGATLNLVNSIAAYAQGGSDLLVATSPNHSTSGTDVLNQGTITGSNDLIMSSVGVPSAPIVSSADPQLRILANYGGITPTFIPAEGSPATGKALASALPALDQRGYARGNAAVGDLGSVQLQHYVVTSAADSGAGSLRQALIDDADQTAITFAPSLAGKVINLTSGPIVLTGDAVINGLGANSLTIQGPGYTGFELFVIGSGVDATISGLTLSGGNSERGGAIFNSGNLDLINDTFSGNVAQGDMDPGLAGLGAGGAIFNASGAILTVTGSTFLNNKAIGAAGFLPPTPDAPTDGRANIWDGGGAVGGAIDNEANARLSLIDDTFSGNSATGGNATSGMLAVHNGEIGVSGNGGSGYGGAVINRGIASVVNSTFADGATYGGQGGAKVLSNLSGNGTVMGVGGSASASAILNQAKGTLSLYNSIAAGTAAGNGDVLNQGTATGSNNVAMAPSGLNSGIIASTADPLLGTLAYHGGTTETINLLAGSSALGAGDVAVAPALDQRGFARAISGAVDAGAFEIQLPLSTASAGPAQTIHAGNAITYDASATQNTGGFSLTYSWTLSDGNNKVLLTVPAGSSPKVTGPSTNLAPGAYTLTVTVSDGFGVAHNVIATSSLTILPAITITSITPAVASGAVNKPFDTVNVAFSAPVDPASVLRAVTFTRQGAADLAHGSGATSITATLVPGTTSTYRIAGLASLVAKAGDGQYDLTVDGTQAGDLYGTGSGKSAIAWIEDATAPKSAVAALPAQSSSATFNVSATGSDPSSNGAVVSGLASYDLWVSANNGAWAFWTNVPASNPTASFAGVPGTTYRFQSFARDNAGNVEAKAAAAEATITLLNTAPPTAAVTKVDASTSAFLVTFAATAAQGNVLDHVDIYASVDGGSPLMIGRSTAGSGTITYQAIADGQAHHYGFFAIGVDKRGNADAMPAGPAYDQNIAATPFAAPAVNAPIALSVDHGEADRSFVRYVDLIFSNNTNLAGLISAGKVHLTQYNLAGGGTPTIVPLAGDLKVVDHAIEVDFGALGLGGSPKTNAADGYYSLSVDGFAKPFTFDRLLGDINGDRIVDATDAALASAALGNTATNQATDVEGTGIVSAADLALVQQAKGRQLAAGLHLDA